MRRFQGLFGLLLLALAGGLSAAHAASTFSGLPAASQPLSSAPTYVPMDQGAGCPTTTPCATVQSPAERLGQPVQQTCSAVATPFAFQQCIDTSVSPKVLKIYLGSTWVTVATLDTTDGLWVPYPIQTTCSSISAPQPYEQCIDTSLSPPVMKTYLGSVWSAGVALDTTNGIWTPPIGGGNPTTVVAAATTNLCSVPQSALTISGSTGITSFGTCTPGILKVLTFSGTPTITYNASTLIIPGAANYTASVNDVFWVESLGGGAWETVAVSPASGILNVQGIIYGGGPSTIAMAATTDLSTVPNANVIVTGSASTTALGTLAAGYEKWLTFASTGGTLVNNNTSLILPGGANIAISAGDTAVVLSLGSGNWRLVAYQPSTDSRPAAPFNWVAPTSTTYTAALIDNGRYLSSKSAGGALTITLPDITTIPVGWNLGFVVDSGNAVSLALNGSHPGMIQVGTGATASSYTSTTAYQISTLQYDGVNFRLLSLYPGGSGGSAGSITTVSSNAALTALKSTDYAVVERLGVYVGVPTVPVLYFTSSTACSLNSGAGDGGTQVPSADSKCWLGQMPTPASPTLWGSSGSASQTTCAITSGLTAMTLGAVGDYVNGEPIFCNGAGAGASTTPPTLSLGAVNGSGTTTYYSLRPIDTGMGLGPAITPVSVSGGATLGTPLALAAGGITGTTHTNTTLDTIVFPGGSCTSFATCGIVIGSYIKKSDITAGTTVSAFPTASSITLSGAATGGSNSATSFSSPTFGVSNNLTITGTSPGGIAIYKGASATLSAMTCIATTDNALGVWRDYGQNHGCPTWVPATADVTQNDALLTTIVSGAGTTSLVVANAAINTVTGTAINVLAHNDSAAIDNSIASGLPAMWNCGTYNQLVGATLSADTVIDGAGCSIIMGWGGVTNITASTGSNQHTLKSLNFSDSQKSAGWDLLANSSSRFLWENINSVNTFNCLEVTGAVGNPRLTNIFCGQSVFNGSYCVYMTGSDNASPKSDVNNPTLTNVNCGPGYSNYAFLFDGIVDSVTMYESGALSSNNELTFQNTVGASRGPHFPKVVNFGVNNAWGPAVKLLADEVGASFNHLYVQCIKGNGQPGVYVSSTSNVNIAGNSTIFGCDKDGIEMHGTIAADASTNIYGNNVYQGFAGGGYAKITIEHDATFANVQLQNGDNGGGTPTEQYGIAIAAPTMGDPNYGAPDTLGSPSYSVGDHAPGYQMPVYDATGQYGLVQVNGQFNSPTSTVVTGGLSPSCTAFTTAQLLGNQNGQVPIIYVSGNIFGGAPTCNTPTAAALITSGTPKLSGAAVNQHFKFQLVNLGRSTATLGAGSGVTVGGQTSAAAGKLQMYDCWATNVGGGTEAVTCNGLI